MKATLLIFKKIKSLALLVNGIAIVIAVVMVIIGAFCVPISELFSMESGIGLYVLRFAILIAGCVFYIIAHELVHGVFMKAFSGMKVKYGFTGLYAYAGSDAYFDKSA